MKMQIWPLTVMEDTHFNLKIGKPWVSQVYILKKEGTDLAKIVMSVKRNVVGDY